MKKLSLLLVSALICGAMVLESSGNGRSPKPLTQNDAQPSGEHQVEGSNVPKPLVSQSFDLPMGYVVGATVSEKSINVSTNLNISVICKK